MDEHSDHRKEKLKLPIWNYQQKLKNILSNNEIFILVGPTGSGKTTQLPQWCYEIVKNNFTASSSNHPKIVGITQPRRVAAVSLASRVAQEMNCELGNLVGYSVRFDDTTSESTQVKFMTDGMLLRESLNDTLLIKYSFIILDEAHERSIHTDVLFTIVKNAANNRKKLNLSPLRVIIMSATLNVEKFSNYFKEAKVYSISGRQYPIEILYSVKPQDDYVHASLVTVFQIVKSEPPGDILVFCTGQEEIENMVWTCKNLFSDGYNILPLPLYAALPFDAQYRVFKEYKNVRKVIFATNIAETSITIPGIRYVVDNGKVKNKSFKSATSMEVLKIENISKAQACQRSGRAGREASGKCYRLYTREIFETFDDNTIPEIKRCNLAGTLLHLAAIGIKKLDKFDFMDKPIKENIDKSIQDLINLGALNVLDDEHKITDLGRKMVDFPLDPKFSRILVASSQLGCSEEILSIISLLSVDKLFHIPTSKRELAHEVLKKFTSSEGDHIMLLKIYRAYKSVKGSKQWCKENFIDSRNISMVKDIRKQLASIYERNNFIRKSCGSNTESVRKCMAIGLYYQMAMLDKDGSYRVKNCSDPVHIHPSSCLFNMRPEYVVYTELVQTNKSYMSFVIAEKLLQTVLSADIAGNQSSPLQAICTTICNKSTSRAQPCKSS